MSNDEELLDENLRAEMAKYDEIGFFRRILNMFKGFGQPRSSREYKEALIELQRLSAPILAILIPFLFVGVLFVVGLMISAYGAGGSALTSLTTSFTVDILGKAGDVKTRKRVHLAMAALMAVTIVVFNALNSTSAIDAVYKLASYTYGPILGLFAFGILTKKPVKDKYVPVVALLAPAICLVLQLNSERWFGGYKFSYELLLLNAALTFLGLTLLIRRNK